MRTSAFAFSALLLSASAVTRAQPDADREVTAETTTQADPVEQARALFREGVGHVEGRDYEAAATSFAAALELHEATSIRFNLASALMELDRYVDAYPHLVGVLADETADAEVRRTTERHLRQATRRIGRLAINANDSVDTVMLDGAAVTPGAQDVAVEPGEHTIEGHHGGAVVVRRQLTVGAGERAHVDLTVLRVEVETEADPIPEPPSHTGRNVGIAVGALALMGAVVAIVLVARSGDDEVRGDFQPGVLRW